MRAFLPMVALSLMLGLAQQAAAQSLRLEPVEVTDWKMVYGTIGARDTVPARARIGGTVAEIVVAEGDRVAAGQTLARIVDPKFDFQLGAVDAQIDALDAQLGNARTELQRGEELLSRGVTTSQQLDSLRTRVDVLSGQIAAARADRRVIEQQQSEGVILAPIDGRVLDVPVTAGAVMMGGEVLATIGGGGFFLRLAVPERHAAALREGDRIEIETAGGGAQGTLAKVYPLIEGGRVIADVEVAGLDVDFVNARVLVRLPVARRMALTVPVAAIQSRGGLDFVTVETGARTMQRVVVTGLVHSVDGIDSVEVLTGLSAGETIRVGADG